MAGLLVDFDRYLAAGEPDLVRDGVSYRATAVWLTDAELRDFLWDLAAAVQPRLANPPGPRAGDDA